MHICKKWTWGNAVSWGSVLQASSTMSLGVDSTSNRYGYQEYFLGGKGGWGTGLTTLPPSYIDCLKIWEPQLSGSLRASNRHA